MYDLIAWDCMDEHTIVFKNPNQERPAVPYTFGMFLNYGFQVLAVFFTCSTEFGDRLVLSILTSSLLSILT